jgi:hypothetical protein
MIDGAFVFPATTDGMIDGGASGPDYPIGPSLAIRL